MAAHDRAHEREAEANAGRTAIVGRRPRLNCS